MKITEFEAQKVRELCEWLKTKEVCTREEAAAAIGMQNDLQFNTRVWWPARQALWALGHRWRSLGGGGRYGITDWKGAWEVAKATLAAAKARFSRAQIRLPNENEVPEEKRTALARARDRMATADWALFERERAKQEIVATTPYTGLLAKSDTPRDTGVQRDIGEKEET